MRRKSWLPFILLNIVISALTTLLVMYLWNRAHPPQEIIIEMPASVPFNQESANTAALDPAALPPADKAVMSIQTVIAPGDVNNEYVILERIGSGILNLNGWYLVNEGGAKYTFPEFEIFTGKIEVHSSAGENNVNKLYMNAAEALWQSGGTVSLFDFANQERATYQIP